MKICKGFCFCIINIPVNFHSILSFRMDILKFKKLSENAIIPRRSSKYSAGLGLFSAESIIIGGYDRAKVKTDIAAKLPYGTYGRIAPEPELEINSFIGIGAGVIDADFTGNIECVIFNHSDNPFVITKGMKIAQF